MKGVKGWLKSFWPAPVSASKLERFYGCVGAFIGLLCTAWLCRHFLGDSSPWLIAPMGASAVLLFAVPSSPLAQPWSIIGGNLISALIGVTCARWLEHDGMAAALAVGAAIAAMFLLRCLHPPSGAVAMTAVLGGAGISDLGYQFVLYPVALNSFVLLALALLFNNLLRSGYPHRHIDHVNIHSTSDPLPRDRLGFTREDLNTVLTARGEVLDISADDLEEILLATEMQAYRRRFGEIRCADIMSRDVVSVRPDAALPHAWSLLQAHRLSMLPVVAGNGQLLGMLSVHDLVRAEQSPAAERLLAGEQVRGVMVKARTARPEWPITDLLQLLEESGLHQVPIVDEHNALLGMLTQSDLIAALFAAAINRKGI